MIGMKETKRKVSAVSWHVVADELRDAVRTIDLSAFTRSHQIRHRDVTQDNAQRRAAPCVVVRVLNVRKERNKMADDDSK